VDDPLNWNHLYRNNGNGTFTDVTAAAGVGDGLRMSFQSVWLDYDNDGWPDLYVINDRWFGNGLYRNSGDGTFTDVTDLTNTSLEGDDVMSNSVGDFDNDGDLDVLSGENQGTLWMYENTDGKGTFMEHVVASDVPAHEPKAADVDCDGDLDLVGKPWGDPGDGAAGRSETLQAHVYFKNQLVERGGPAVFTRPKGEVWNVPDKGNCKR
jgi:hypothetical protein